MTEKEKQIKAGLNNALKAHQENDWAATFWAISKVIILLEEPCPTCGGSRLVSSCCAATLVLKLDGWQCIKCKRYAKNGTDCNNCPDCTNHIPDVKKKVEPTRHAHREICSLCHEVNRVGFWVPNYIWRLSVHKSQINDIICLQCFTRLADERKVEWDKNIRFYPVSSIPDHIVTDNKKVEPGDAELISRIKMVMEMPYQIMQKEPQKLSVTIGYITPMIYTVCDRLDTANAENKHLEGQVRIAYETIDALIARAEAAEAKLEAAEARIEEVCIQAESVNKIYLATQAKLEAAEAERDLAIAHDRQPYPTAQAYEKVCAALHSKEDELELANVNINQQIADLKAENKELILASPDCCWRKCRNCGKSQIHRELVTPGVLCRFCGSQDTRLLKKETQALKGVINK
ncbi:MAG: hypothetical protein MUO31_13140 [Thermodesulfovibrionales bacterium]|nr:hypothetical protein [Thermodesulfovibrionales bacterium]